MASWILWHFYILSPLKKMSLKRPFKLSETNYFKCGLNLDLLSVNVVNFNTEIFSNLTLIIFILSLYIKRIQNVGNGFKNVKNTPNFIK